MIFKRSARHSIERGQWIAPHASKDYFKQSMKPTEQYGASGIAAKSKIDAGYLRNVSG